MLNKLQESSDYIKSKFDFNPDIGIVLGTGLGDFVNSI